MFGFRSLWGLAPLQSLWSVAIAVLVLAVIAICLFVAAVPRWRRETPWRRAWEWGRAPRLFWAWLIAPLLLTACASTSSLSPTLRAVQAFVVAEQAFDTAVQAADIAIDTGALPAATVTQIKTLADEGYADVKVGRAAITAADATSIAAETTALTALVTQIAALVPAKA